MVASSVREFTQEIVDSSHSNSTDAIAPCDDPSSSKSAPPVPDFNRLLDLVDIASDLSDNRNKQPLLPSTTQQPPEYPFFSIHSFHDTPMLYSYSGEISIPASISSERSTLDIASVHSVAGERVDPARSLHNGPEKTLHQTSCTVSIIMT